MLSLGAPCSRVLKADTTLLLWRGTWIGRDKKSQENRENSTPAAPVEASGDHDQQGAKA